MPKKGKKTKCTEISGESSRTTTNEQLCHVKGCTESATEDASFEVFDFYGFTDPTKKNLVCDNCVAKCEQATKKKLESKPNSVATTGRKEMSDPSSETPPGYYTHGFIGRKPAPATTTSTTSFQMDSGNWPEFIDAARIMLVRLKSDSNTKRWKNIVDARFLLVDSNFRDISEPLLQFKEFPIGEFKTCFFNLTHLTVNCVKYKTWQLGAVLQKTKQLKSLSLVNIRWEEETSNDPSISVPRIPTLKYLQLQNHQVEDSYLNYDFIQANQKILRRFVKNLKHLNVDGQICFHTTWDTDKDFYKVLDVLEINHLNPKEFVESPLAFAPLQRLIIHKIHKQEEDGTAIQEVWKFISKFSETLSHLHLNCLSLWPNNTSERFQPDVSFPEVKRLEISCPKQADDFILLRKMILARFPALEMLVLLEASERFETNEIPILAKLVHELEKESEYLKIRTRIMVTANFTTPLDSQLLSQKVDEERRGAIEQSEKGSGAGEGFQCSLCSRNFERKSFLAKHMRVHGIEKKN